MTTEQIVRKWVEQAWNHGRFEDAARLYAPSYVLHDPSVPGGEVRGAAGLEALIGSFRAAFPDLEMALDVLVATEDIVVWRFRVTGTHRGELMQIPPSGRPVDIHGMVASRFEAGRWAEDHAFWDVLGMLRQIGVPALV